MILFRELLKHVVVHELPPPYTPSLEEEENQNGDHSHNDKGDDHEDCCYGSLLLPKASGKGIIDQAPSEEKFYKHTLTDLLQQTLE